MIDRSFKSSDAPVAPVASGTMSWPRVFPAACIVSRSSCGRTGYVPGRDVVGCRRTSASEPPCRTTSLTARSRLYVAAIVDLFSRRVVGWAMKAEMTAQLVIDALIMAIWRRGRPDSLLHHSDQGSAI
jgi:transposase InsO family protein